MTPIHDCKNLGRLVRAQRKAQGLTQVQAADFCGVGVRFIHDLERGKASIHLGKALDVLATLGIRLHARCGLELEPE